MNAWRSFRDHGIAANALAGWRGGVTVARMDVPASPAGLDSHEHEQETLELKRVRLLASLTLIGGIGLVIALPFALRAGAEFFLPVTAALVIAIALVPMLEWFERRGVPAKLAAVLCVVIFLMIAVFAIASIVLPAIDWVALIPSRIERVTKALAPLLDLYSNLQKFIDRTVSDIAVGAADNGRTVRVETPNSMLDLITASAPHAAIQLFFALLVIYFFLAGWTGDAQAHDRQPRQLRRRADHRARHPAGRRRDLDLYRHHHRHQRRRSARSPR